jgi:hypothetical protein
MPDSRAMTSKNCLGSKGNEMPHFAGFKGFSTMPWYKVFQGEPVKLVRTA